MSRQDEAQVALRMAHLALVSESNDAEHDALVLLIDVLEKRTYSETLQNLLDAVDGLRQQRNALDDLGLALDTLFERRDAFYEHDEPFPLDEERVRADAEPALYVADDDGQPWAELIDLDTDAKPVLLESPEGQALAFKWLLTCDPCRQAEHSGCQRIMPFEALSLGPYPMHVFCLCDRPGHDGKGKTTWV